MKKWSIALLALMTAMTASCRSEKKAEQLDRVVWSNDGTQQAFVVLRFDEKKSGNPLDGTTIKRNFNHQIFVQDPDGLNMRAVSNPIMGQNATDLFYMKSAGYIVASFLQETGENGEFFVRYYQLLMDGTTRTLTTAPYTRAIPSPDGKYIARVESNPENCRPDTSDNESHSCHVFVEFLDAQTLVRQGRREKIVFENPSKVPDVTWNPHQQFIVTNQVEAHALQADVAPVSTDVPGCIFPKTSSDHINADGVFVFPNGNTVDSRIANDDDPKWGCQSE